MNSHPSPTPAPAAPACDCPARVRAWINSGGDPFYAADVERRFHATHDAYAGTNVHAVDAACLTLPAATVWAV